MEYFDSLILMLSKLNALQAFLLVCAALIFFISPYLVKKKYLKRTKQKYDEVIEDRNSWILIPPPYNLIEKIFVITVYIVSFILIIFAVNMKD